MKPSSYLNFFRKVMAFKDVKKDCSLGAIGKRFDREVNKGDYDPHDRDEIINYIYMERQKTVIK